MNRLLGLLAFPFFFLAGQTLGCPCCGPAWYRKATIWEYQARGWPVPPELGGNPV